MELGNTALIKNGYDADAENVTLTFENFGENKNKHGKITIQDNGYGMDYDSLINKWMVIGTDDKERHPFTKYKKRRVIGNKGIGRFATEKLCTKLTLISKPKRSNDEIKLTIDWNKFEQAGITFEDVDNPIEIKNKKDKEIGVTLILENLREEWTPEKVDRLQIALGSLVLPKELTEIKKDKFEINISAKDFEQTTSSKIQSILFKHAPYKITSTIAENSYESRVVIREEGKIVLEEKVDLSDTIMENGEQWNPFGKCKLTMYFFPGQSRYEDWNKYYRKALAISNITQFLTDLHGVKIYRDGFWIRPYGDLGDDWLSLEAERVQANYKIGNSQVVGFVQISKDYNSNIIDTTTRERVVENNAYHSMRIFVKESIDSISTYRKEKNRKLKDKQTIKQHENLISSDIKHLTDMIETANSITKDDKKKFQSTVKNIASTFKDYEQTTEDEIDDLESRQRSYRNLASLGISSATTAHEIKQVISHLGAIPEKIINKLKDDASAKKLIYDDIETANDKINTIRYYMGFIIHFVQSLSSENEIKREKEKINIFEELENFKENFEGVLRRNDAVVSISVKPDNMSIYIHRADFSSIILNLFTNSLKAIQKITSDSKRKIRITVSKDTTNFKIKFSDNGLGIKDANRDKIFRLFFTTNRQGTGLGLSILKELIEDYGGTIKLADSSEIESGATFNMVIPLEELKK